MCKEHELLENTVSSAQEQSITLGMQTACSLDGQKEVRIKHCLQTQ